VRLLKHRRTSPAPDTTPVATLLARLVELFTAAVTSVRTHWSRPARHVQGSRLAIVSSPDASGLISRARIQKRPSTRPGQAFPDSAPSLLRLTGKGLTPRSSLSCSRSAVWADTRRLSRSGSSVLPPGGSRRQRTFHEPVELCTRLALRLWSVSRGGIGSAPCSLRTRFESNHSAGLHGRAFPVRPHSRTAQCHEIESGDYSLWVAEDYFQKPLSNVASISRCTTLYGTRT